MNGNINISIDKIREKYDFFSEDNSQVARLRDLNLTYDNHATDMSKNGNFFSKKIGDFAFNFVNKISSFDLESK